MCRPRALASVPSAGRGRRGRASSVLRAPLGRAPSTSSLVGCDSCSCPLSHADRPSLWALPSKMSTDQGPERCLWALLLCLPHPSDWGEEKKTNATQCTGPQRKPLFNFFMFLSSVFLLIIKITFVVQNLDKIEKCEEENKMTHKPTWRAASYFWLYSLLSSFS